MPYLQAFLQLIRWDKPIGSLLLLWPTYWALWLASEGFPSLKWMVIFTAGVFLMRSAGCIVNDLADKKFDGAVSRTQHRPLVLGLLSHQQAKKALLLFLMASASLLFFMPLLSWVIAVIAVLLTGIYPFMKRYTSYPQVVLGLAWGTSVFLVFSALKVPITMVTLALYLAVVFWVIAFDAYYAMVDWSEDLKIGVRSLATRFAKKTPTVALMAHLLSLGLLAFVGYAHHLAWPYAVSWCISAALVVYQYCRVVKVIDNLALLRSVAFSIFLQNQWIGFIIWLGIFISKIM